jgi:hypothetical protein
MGKWHIGDEVSAQHGFDEWTSIEGFYLDCYTVLDELNNLVNDTGQRDRNP